MDGVELFGGEEAIAGQDKSNGPNVDGLIEDERGAGRHWTAGGLLGHEFALGLEGL
jgi:hypothetical protein